MEKWSSECVERAFAFPGSLGSAPWFNLSKRIGCKSFLKRAIHSAKRLPCQANASFSNMTLLLLENKKFPDGLLIVLGGIVLGATLGTHKGIEEAFDYRRQLQYIMFCIRGTKGMKEEDKKKIEQLMANIQCPKDFKCAESGFERLCMAKDFGHEKYLECLEENPSSCIFALTFGDVYLCECSLRVYLAKKLKK